MNYFSGFSLSNENELFSQYVDNNINTIYGFSYGAIRAFEHAYSSNHTFSKLVLLSPAFFQDTSKSFKKTQLLYFKKDSLAYIDQFSKNIAFPSNIDMSSYIENGSYEELEELLTYEWSYEKLKSIKEKGTAIEVYLGSEDQIVNTEKAYEFFSKITEPHLINGVGHILKAA